jgi:hypothetical protein
MDKNTEGRVPIEIIEIDLDYCQNIFGDSVCLASLSESVNKCYNTFGTCAEPDNFVAGTYTYKFCTDQSDIPRDATYYPFIQSAKVSPGKINPLDADQNTSPLGKRMTLSVTMTDHPSTDRYIDPYYSERLIGTAQLSGEGFNPLERSTFWRKFKARNPHYKNRVIRYISGYIDDGVLFDTVTQYFVITNISESDSKGRIQIQAKDVMYLAQREKALAPNPNSGYLSASLTSGATSFSVSPSGIGDAEYSASGYLRIDSEVMSFTRVTDTFTVTRAQFNTTAVAHDSEAAVQECLYFNAQLPYQILTTLLQTYAEIDSSYLDTAQWYDESVTLNNLPQAYTALITEPISVEKLINEMVEQMYFYIWYSSRDAVVKIRAVRPINEDVITELNYDEHIIDGSLSVKEDASKLLTRCVVNYAMIDPTKPLDEITNFSASQINVNLDAESTNQYRDKKTKVINSRWIESGGGGAAAELASRYIARLQKPLKSFSFSLDAKDREIWLSDFVRISSPFVVDSVGNDLPVDAHVIQAQEQVAGSVYSYSAEEYVYEQAPDDATIYLIRTGAGTVGNENINLRAWYDGQFPASPPTASDIIYFILEENVIANATTVSNYAIEVLAADFPAGCEVHLWIKSGAWVVGKGGAGGAGGSSVAGSNGQNGGTAMKIEFPVIIKNEGIIGGGGGGGGGGGTIEEAISIPTNFRPPQIIGGGGGGGGAGYGAGGAVGYSYGRNPPRQGTTITSYPTSGNSGSLIYGERGRRGDAVIVSVNRYWVAFFTAVASGDGGNGGDLGQNGTGGGTRWIQVEGQAVWTTSIQRSRRSGRTCGRWEFKCNMGNIRRHSRKQGELK